jgi:hypothetical protein
VPTPSRRQFIKSGTLDWSIKNYFVEMDLPLMQASVPYLRHLQVQ